MTTNKHTATRKTSNGNTITVTVERGTYSDAISLDGQLTGLIKTYTIDRTEIVIKDASGKTMGSASEISPLSPHYNNYAEAVKCGCVGMVGKVYLMAISRDLIVDALAEANAAAPKTAEQIAIETAKAQSEAKHDAWYNSPEQIAYRKFTAEMDRPDSDY